MGCVRMCPCVVLTRLRVFTVTTERPVRRAIACVLGDLFLFGLFAGAQRFHLLLLVLDLLHQIALVFQLPASSLLHTENRRGTSVRRFVRNDNSAATLGQDLPGRTPHSSP